MVNASEEDRNGRYYHKSLEEVDELSLVRDRTGQNQVGDEGSDEELVEVAEDDVKDEDDHAEKEVDERLSRFRRQLDMEDEWGLHRSRPASQDDSEKAERDGPETESEERDQEEYRVCSSSRASRI